MFEREPTAELVLRDLEAYRAIEFSLDPDRVRAFAERMDRDYAAAAKRQVRFNELNQMDFVPWPRRYWLFHNCNHATASWLGELGVAVGGLHATSDFRVRREFMGRVVEVRSVPADRGRTGVPARTVESPVERPGAPASRRAG